MGRPYGPWFRQETDILHDPHYQSMPFDMQAIYHNLLCIAAKGQPPGSFSGSDMHDLAGIVAHGSKIRLLRTVDYCATQWIDKEISAHHIVLRDGWYFFTTWQRDHESPVPPLRLEWNRLAGKLRPVVFARDGYECVYCGRADDLTADHIIPLARGGDSALDNLQTLCRPCNGRKGDR